ncbi:electron transport complex subunit RsxC [Clostridium ihumii]|uniref:electron transport complex subunit RsxC n=1 Tax=Clostridium ihumii TaxID=1470356 RepID=UPI00058C5BB4|nr:electron transport complex subunit RsxC [Clostridium ihumii]
MGLFSFKGGIHPPHGKHLSKDTAIESLLPKKDLIFPMSQHIGAPCEPTVKKGDRVLVGQKIGQATGFVSAPIHCSVSGTVKDIKPVLTSSGKKVMSVIVENDNLYEKVEVTPHKDYKSLSKDQLLEIIKEGGIVGLGGACFPTHVKLAPKTEIDTIIINGAECEPYLTCDYRLMVEKHSEIIEGLEILKHMFPKANIYIGIEDNKSDAISIFNSALEDTKGIEVKSLKTKYPQGAEKQLIYATTKRMVPTGKLPADVGCIVQNLATVYAIRNLVIDGMPLTERIVTVTGEAITTPKNLLVKFGTSLTELIDACGGFKQDPVKVLSGGPMMGMSLISLDIPSIKGTSGILALTKDMADLSEESSCIRCGRCVEACPMFLTPYKLNSYVLRGEFEEFEKLNGLSCIECGACSYICPAKRHLTQSCREGKRVVMNNRKKSK